MTVRYLDAAQQDLVDAIVYLEDRSAGLGRRLHAEIQRAEKLIVQFPLAASEIRPSIRRRLIRKFPYALIYTVEDGAAIILAVSHLSREPNYWIERRY